MILSTFNNSTFAPLIHQNYYDARLIFINSRPSIHPRVDTFDPSSRTERSRLSNKFDKLLGSLKSLEKESAPFVNPIACAADT